MEEKRGDHAICVPLCIHIWQIKSRPKDFLIHTCRNSYISYQLKNSSYTNMCFTEKYILIKKVNNDFDQTYNLILKYF